MADPLYVNKDPVTGLPLYDANEMRQAMALALMYGGRNMGARQGVRPGGTAQLVTLTGSTITVTPFVSCIDPGLTTPQGPYWVAIPAVENPGPLNPADVSNPRKDIVVVRVYDTDADNSGLRTARSEYLAGVAGPNPAYPQTPAGAILMATIDVPVSGGGAPAVTNVYPYTVASGGLLPVRNQAERDAIVAPYDGFPIWRTDRHWKEVYDGTAWRVQGVPIVASVADLAAITTPVNGMVAWNTSDAELYARVAGAWRRANWNEPWGEIGGRKNSGSVAGIAATSTVVQDSGPVTLLAGRRYRCWTQVGKSPSGSNVDWWYFLLLRGSPTGPAVGDVLSKTETSAFGGQYATVESEIDITATVTETWYLTCQRLSGTDTLTVTRAPLVFHDLGPTGRLNP